MPDLQDALQIVDEEQGAPKRKLRPRKLKVDKDEVITEILEKKKWATDARSVWEENHARWLAKYLGQLENLEGGFNVHVPVLLYHVQRTAAGLTGALLSGGRVVRARARNRAFLEREELVTEFLNYQLLHELDLDNLLDRLATDFLVHGKFIVKVPWEIRKETTRRVEKFPPELSEEEILLELYPERKEVLNTAPFTYRVKRKPEGAEKDNVTVTDVVEFYPAEDVTEVVITGEETTWANPRVVRKRIDDVIVPNPDTLTDILKANWVIDRYWITVDEIKRLQRDGIYDLLTKEDLAEIEGLASVDKQSTGESMIKQVSADQQGVEEQEDETGTRRGLTILECYWQWDVDGDGLKERVIFWVVEEARKLARARYLSEVYRDYEWPFAEAGFIPTEGFYHIGVPELAEGLQDAIVALHNQGLEWGMITSQPFGFYRPSSGMKAEQIRYKAGELIPLDDPQNDVVFPNWPQANQQWRFNEEALLNQYLDRALAQGPVQFGQPPEGRSSALRTARATLALIGQSDLLADLTLRRFYRGVQRVFHLVWRRDKEFLPPGRAFRVVGAADPFQDPFREVPSKDELAGDYDFELIGSNFTANKDFIRQTLLLVFQSMLNPLLLQTGVVNVRNIYEISKELLLALERRDFDKFITKPPLAAMEPPKDPELEHTEMMNGVPARVNPNEDVNQHLQKHMEFVMSDAFGAVPAHYVPLFKAHIQETMQAIQMFQNAQAAQLQAAGDAQSQLAGNPMIQGALEGGLGVRPPIFPESPAPGALGPGGRGEKAKNR